MFGPNKQQNHEAEAAYLKRMLSGIDENIPLPGKLHGAALRDRLDAIPAPVTREEKRRSFWRGSSIFTSQSALSFAMTIAVMIGVVYIAGRTIPNMIDGNILIRPESTEAAMQQEAASESPASSETEVLPAEGSEAVLDDVQAGSPNEDGQGTGGGGRAVPMGTFAGYGYAWRANDMSDPHKGGYPITVDIVDGNGTLAAQVDISDITEIYQLDVQGDALLIIGAGDEGVVTRTYSGMEAMQPEPSGVLAQPGVWHSGYLDANGAAYTLTMFGTLPEMDAYTVEGSTANNVCIIGALAGGENNLLAVAGAGEVTLQNGQVAVVYPDETGATQSMFIVLNGVDIEP
jgi:hypothetical protein